MAANTASALFRKRFTDLPSVRYQSRSCIDAMASNQYRERYCRARTSYLPYCFARTTLP